MNKVKVFQIGLGSFGRYGFEKFVEMEKNLPEADVELVGVADSDLERLRSAEKFADVHDLELETFRNASEMYSRAEEVKHESGDDTEILVYDAGPTESHSDHIYESLQRGFYHLAEKPSSMKRDEHLREKRLAEDRNVIWKVDFIERENPVVKKTLELLGDEEIGEIKVFRESCIGVEKLINPVKRLGVKGGDILDKMVHEVYVLDFLEEVNGEFDLELEDAGAEYFMPKDFDSQKLMSLTGGYTTEITQKTATAMTEASFSSNGTNVELNSSWLGTSEGAMRYAKKVREINGDQVLERDTVEEDEKAHLNEEARFFVIDGSRKLLGDMLHERLYDLESGEEIELRDYMHDQLYRVLESSVLEAAGISENPVSEKETDVFMNTIFDIRDEVVERDDFREALESGKEKLDSLVVTDGKILENEESERIAG
ncbi:MAG: Gfo/Idh/MocA family protein [Candidatus Nanosalina sp.]